MDYKNQCFHILSQVKDDVAKLKFDDIKGLKTLFETTVIGDQKRLEDSKTRRIEAQQKKQEEEKRLDAMKKKLQSVIEEKEKIHKAKDALLQSQSSQVSVGSSKENKCLKKLLDTYKEITGVIPDYTAPDGSVRGVVAVKGAIPSESKLLPFNMTVDESTTEKLWEKIEEASTSDDAIDEQVRGISLMEIERRVL